MGTATILGESYGTVIMPDGMQWITRNLSYKDAIGQWWLNGASDDGDGAYYAVTEILALQALLDAEGEGWHWPSYEELDALRTALIADNFIPPGNNSAGSALKADDASWTAPNVGPLLDKYGFTLRGAGYKSGFDGNWYDKGVVGRFQGWSPAPYGSSLLGAQNNAQEISNILANPYSSERTPIRLVRTPPDLTPVDRAESVSYDYSLALDWDTALDGTPICIDDGATYDYIESTITMRLTPTELAEWETAWEGNGIVYPPGTGRLLGPTVDHSGADIACTLQDFVIDGPADSAMKLFDVTARLHYNGLGTPSAGSPSPLMDRGVPYHSIRPDYRSIILDSGGAAVVPYSGASTRMTKWYSSGLTLSEAQDAINWLRTLRGSQYAWTVGGTGFPFGPSKSQTNTIWIPAWKCLRESNFTYGFELEIVLDG